MKIPRDIGGNELATLPDYCQKFSADVNRVCGLRKKADTKGDEVRNSLRKLEIS